MRPVFSLVMMFAELSMGSAATPQAPPVRSTPQAPEVREVVPYASLFAHCSRGGSGTLYVGIPAPKDANGVYAVLAANNREGIAVGVYDCGPNNTITKRAVAVAPVPFPAKTGTSPIGANGAASTPLKSTLSTATERTTTFVGPAGMLGITRFRGVYYGSTSSCPSGNCPSPR